MLADQGLVAKEDADIICYGKQSVRQLGRLPKLTNAEGMEATRYSAPQIASIRALVELAI